MKIREATNIFFTSEDGKFDRKKENAQENVLSHRLDVRCLKNAVAGFLASGLKDDAFDVYFCFSEIYKLFGEGYEGNTQKLLNILGDHETKAGGIKDTFRDHYSHAVYVFSLGLAVYQLNQRVQSAFKKTCVMSKTMTADEEFLYRWGITALFHDIGYPFEIAFNNIKEYVQDVFATVKSEDGGLVIKKGAILPLLSYLKIDEFISFSEEEKDGLKKLKIEDKYKENLHTLLAYRVSQMIGEDYQAVLNLLDGLMASSVKFMDHAYFSATVLLKKLLGKPNGTAEDLWVYVDACANILLHSGFWRNQFASKRGSDGSVEIIRAAGLENPLMFLIILCDELHIFDRIGYGKKSKEDPLPKRCYIEQTEKGIEVTYAFTEQALKYKGEGSRYGEGDYIEDKLYSKRYGGEGVLYKLAILDFKDFGEISILPEIKRDFTVPVYHMSASFYQNILSLAQKIHENYSDSDTYDKLLTEWDAMSLEEKMWNISAAKSYAEKLDMLGYFYDDKELLVETVRALNPEQVERLARAEHKRWENERIGMGWTYAEYNAADTAVKDDMRSIFKRRHNCLKPYDDLNENDKNKDRLVVRNIIKNLNEKGFFVYDPSKKREAKNDFYIGITGHSDLSRANGAEIKKRLKEILEKYAADKSKNIVVNNACDKGFDSLAAAACMELGLKTRIILPFGFENPLKDLDNTVMSALLQYEKKEVFVLPQITRPDDGVPESEKKFIDLARFLAANSDQLIVGWDGKETEKGKHGTFYTKQLAQKYGKGIEIINVPR